METNDLLRREELRARYTVLSECLTMVEAMKRIFSTNEASLTPKAGFEQAFAEEEKRLETLRAMLREIRAEEDKLVRSMYGLKRKG